MRLQSGQQRLLLMLQRLEELLLLLLHQRLQHLELLCPCVERRCLRAWGRSWRGAVGRCASGELVGVRRAPNGGACVRSVHAG